WAGGNWAGGKWMPYVTGGYASARFEEQGIFRVTGVTFDQDSERHDGWYIGGGLDWAFSDHIIVGVEYRHFEFETRNYKEFGVPAGAFPLDNLNLRPDMDTVTLRTSWKFGGDRSTAPLK